MQGEMSEIAKACKQGRGASNMRCRFGRWKRGREISGMLGVENLHVALSGEPFYFSRQNFLYLSFVASRGDERERERKKSKTINPSDGMPARA